MDCYWVVKRSSRPPLMLYPWTLSLAVTMIDTVQTKDYHYEDGWPEDVIYQGYGGVDCVEAGGPPAGAGCGGYAFCKQNGNTMAARLQLCCILLNILRTFWNIL